MICVGLRFLRRLPTSLKSSALTFCGNQLVQDCTQFSSAAYVWGAGDGGQLGTGKQEQKTQPIKLQIEAEVYHVACGYGFTVAAEPRRCRLWTTGLNSFFQLGTHLHNNTKKDLALTPIPVDLEVGSPSTRIQQISCGRSHSAVLTDSGEVFMCGGNFQGQCGVGKFSLQCVEHYSRISHIAGDIKQVACGLDHTLLLTSDGKVLSCGWGADGQTGMGHFKNESSFKVLEGDLRDVKVKEIATSADCCLALSEEGEVFSWGNNEYGQLALPSDQEQLARPSRASLLETLPEVVHVAAGGSFCVVLTATGEVYSWGYGVLGHGRKVSCAKTPTKIQELDNIGESVCRLWCGPDQAAVLTDSGHLYTWGRGSFGRLGIGSTHDQWIPKKVNLPAKVTEVSCGVDHMAVIVTDS